MPEIDVSQIDHLIAPPPLNASRGDLTERPVADVIRPAGEVSKPGAALLGVPFDTTTLMRPGARFGPSGVRHALESCLSYDPNWGVDLAAGPVVADCGDVAVLQTDVTESWRRISAVTERLAAGGIPLVVIGGDHGVTFPVLRGLVARPRRLGLVNLDAHFDFRPRGEQITSAMPFRLALEDLAESLSPRNFVELGAGGWRGNRRYQDELEALGSLVITTRQLHGPDFTSIVDAALDRASAGTDGIWLSVDVDVIDGAFLPGTAAPGVAGLTPMQVLEIVWACAQRPQVAGLDVMELAPIYDPDGASAKLVAQIVLTFLAGLQRR